VKKAFTILELVIITLIIGVLATLAMQSYRHFIWRARLAEVYQTVDVIARAEEMYYLANGQYTTNPVSDCYVGNGTEPGSTAVQRQLGIEFPSNYIFTYLVYPSTTSPDSKTILFKQLGYDWCYWYNYTTKEWVSYGGGDAGPACQYFNPSS